MNKYSLIGIDGNAFSIMGYVVNAMKGERKTEAEIDAYTKSAMSSNYNNLLAVSSVVILKLNKINND